MPLGVNLADLKEVRVTEGALKADVCVALSGCPTIGLPGIGTIKPLLKLLPSTSIERVVLAPDADFRTNLNVAKAIRNLYRELSAIKDKGERNYQIAIEYWNPEDGKGLDDLLAAGKKPECLDCKTWDDLRPLIGNVLVNEELHRSTRESRTGSRDYEVCGGKLTYIKRVETETEINEIPKTLCNFNARIVEQISRDDGAETRQMFILEGERENGRPFPRIEVPAGEFARMDWVVERWGAKAIISAGQGWRDHTRAAIQELSGEIPSRTLYECTGWHRIGEHWAFLHGDGAIGPTGMMRNVEVSLSGAASTFRLPQPPVGEQLIRSVCKSCDSRWIGPGYRNLPTVGNGVSLCPRIGGLFSLAMRPELG